MVMCVEKGVSDMTGIATCCIYEYMMYLTFQMLENHVFYMKLNNVWFEIVLCVNKDGSDMVGIATCCIHMMY